MLEDPLYDSPPLPYLDASTPDSFRSAWLYVWFIPLSKYARRVMPPAPRFGASLVEAQATTKQREPLQQ